MDAQEWQAHHSARFCGRIGMPKRRKGGTEALKMEARSRKRGEQSRKRRDLMNKLLDAFLGGKKHEPNTNE